MAKENSNPLKIKRLPYSRLLKAETSDYSERVIAIIKEHKPKSVFINQLFGLLLKKKDAINLLRLNYGVDIERLKERKQKEDMLLKISMFKLKVRMLDSLILESDLYTLNNAVNTFLRNLHKCKNDKVLNQKVLGFFYMIANNETLAEAINKYGLDDEVDQVCNSHKMFNSIVEKRIELLSKRPKVLSRAISKDLLNRIDHLFQAIELAYIVSQETAADAGMDSSEDLARLLKTLNQLSVMFYKSAKLREQNNQRIALMEQDNDLDAVVTNDILCEATTPTDHDHDPATISIERDDYENRVDIIPPKRVEHNPRSHSETLLLESDPQKEFVKQSNTKAFSADKIETKLLESST